MITTKNLCKSFNEHTHVLKGISETIDKGEKVVVIGPSGSGKSTFLRCLNLLETPTDGEIWFEGENITAPGCDIQKVRRKMGMVFQQFNLFPHMTVLQNITFAPVKLGLMNQQEAEKKARELLGENMTLAAIAERTGFANERYFSRVFKLYCGCTPLEYRMKLLKGKK